MIMQKNEVEFLKQNNLIEGVTEDLSLDMAKEAWTFLKTQNTLSLPIIKQAHKILMLFQDIEEKYKGEFRDVMVYVSNLEMHKARDIETLLERWLADANNTISLGGTEAIPNQYLKDVIKSHVEFENIHPFIDGNGRIGRMLMNWIYLKMGMDLMIIKDSEKRAYYEWFGNVGSK